MDATPQTPDTGLVLTRTVGQTTVLVTPDGGRIEIDVVRSAGDRLRLKFRASKEVQIFRKEIEGRFPQHKPAA